MDINTTEFNGAIKKIKTRRIVCIVFTVLCILGIFLSAPLYLEIMGDVIIDTDGSYGLIILFAIGVFVSLFAYILVSTPIYNALYMECDARKHLIMLTTLEKERGPIYQMLSNAYFYLGDFDTAIYYDEKAVGEKKIFSKLSALYGKARSEFFAGRLENFKKTAFDFQVMTKNAKLNEKQRKGILECHTVINLLLAITNEDIEKIKEFASRLDCIKDDNKIASAFVNYLRGIASYALGDKIESTHRFMTVCDIASKTVLGTLAKEFLEKLNSENDTDSDI